MELTEGTLYLSHTPSASRRSLISQAKMPGSLLVGPDVLHHGGGGDLRLAAPNGSQASSLSHCSEPGSC